MEFVSVKEYAEKYGMSERTVRNQCAQGKIPGAVLIGKTWMIPTAFSPEQAVKSKGRPSALLKALQEQMNMKMKGGIYHRTQIDLTYNSNHIEGSKLTHEQTRAIFETNTVGMSDGAVRVDDIMETVNHFRCVDMIITHAQDALTEQFIKELHGILKSGTTDSTKDWFRVGDYKLLPNEVGGQETCAPEDVSREIKSLLKAYRSKKKKTFDDLLDFHKKFEAIHPFQDGNGRVGRLILFKECLCNRIVPFIITEELRYFYYRGLQNWPQTPGYLRDTCLTAQDQYKELMRYFRIEEC